MKFKVGDKVKILPSAVDINVAGSEIGEIGIVVYVYAEEEYSIKTASGYYEEWWVRARDIAPAIIKGQQLLFDFMQQS